ncbi:hypothetical protein HHK36_011259 [Tetracentron sinense]|uniref:C2 NT-type domain-containing protein n=1 Tax=Tetracentron sinense TaxID=13715 RepID=A0A834ZIA4_TETSI|nr:hypothetical protein HHK36_011259 [Tetracentron sinense]
MFRLHRHKPEKSGERIDFKFSNFQALQVPKGWDKLFVSIISVETGKTITKSSKALVRNGNCQWTETLSESIWVSQDDSSKELEECFFKLVVAMGSARSGILGEATVNLTGYMSSRSSAPVSLPLKKCNHGTILQVKIQCLTPRTRLRDEQWTHTDDLNANNDDMDNKSDGSDNIFTRSAGSSSSNHLGSIPRSREFGSRGTSVLASGSHHSSDSADGSLDREFFSPRININGDVYNLIGRQDSTGSQNTTPHVPVDDPSRSNHSSFTSRATGSGSYRKNQQQEFGKSSSHVIAESSLRNASSSKDLLEAAEDSIEELRAEAKMWERNARKLMVDLEILRKEFFEQSRNQANLDMELSAAHTERDGLKQEMEQLKILLEESMVKHTATENSNFHAEGMTHIQKELEDEIKFLQESNANLTLQLQKTQKSNLELVSVLQELEETIEKQKLEIDNLSALKLEFGDMENYSHGNEDNRESNSTEEALAKMIRKDSSNPNLEGSNAENKIRNFHEHFGSEDSRNLEHKLQQLQESQKNLQATVQFLEKNLEEKNHEIEIERGLKTQTLLDSETEWRCQLSAKDEEIINLETKLSKSLNAHHLEEMGFANGGDPNLIREVEALKAKVQELEMDCNELTDENLELIFNLKESKRDLLTRGTSFNTSSNELPANDSASTSETEVSELKSQIYHLEQELKKKEILNEGFATSRLRIQLIDLENKCTDLELQLQSFKDKAFNLDAELHKSRVEAEEREMEISALQKQLESFQGKETCRDDCLTVSYTKLENSESHTAIEMSKIFCELLKQLQLTFAHVKKPWFNICSRVNTECEYGLDIVLNASSTDMITQKEQAEAILNNLVGLNKLLEAKIIEYEYGLQHSEVEIKESDKYVTEVQNKLEDYSLKESTLHISFEGPESLNMELEAKVKDPSKDLESKSSEIGGNEANLSSKEEEIEALRHCERELEAQISNLQMEKRQLEENMEIVLRESSITSQCLDDLRNDLMVLSSSVNSHVSANKVLERTSSELESSKRELELHLCEVEVENIQLSERISGLEAQLRYLTDERESSRLELENSEALVMNLRDEIRRLGTEMETQKVDLKQKLQDMQKRWSEAQEECEYLNKANPKLQAMAESLIEECSSLQKSNGDLRKQKLELHEHCALLEAELRESRKCFSDCSKKVEVLEAKFSSMQEEIASKEKMLNSELDALVHENNEYKEKLILGESLLNQLYLEKTVEVENLQREVAHLTEQISATHDERERIASDAVLEVSSLRADKTKLETALQEFQAKVKLFENELHTLQIESGAKVIELTGELAASKQCQELLMADHEKLVRLLEDVKSSKEEFKSSVNGLELKLAASEYERKQQVEEISSLKIQLQKIAHLQDEVVALKSSLNDTKFEKEKLEASLQLLSADCEELKAERVSFVAKLSIIKKAMSELEECKRTKIALEEKLLRLEGDLTAREALCAQDAELKNELSRIKRSNSQYRRKILHLEEEKDEFLKREQALEEELKLKKEDKQSRSPSINNKIPVLFESNTKFISNHEELKLPESDNKHHYHNGNPQVIGVDPLIKIQLLENDLSKALEENSMYKVQLKRLLSEGENGHADAPKKLTTEGEIKKEGKWLEAELRDIRERYFQMSLRYAEVEAEREELVMKLRTVKNGKRWFS